MLPAQHSAEASTDAISERRASMDSVRTEDSCESNLGDSYEHLQRHSPTSLLPEHPFSPPVLKVCLAVASPLGLTSTRLARIQLQQVAAFSITIQSTLIVITPLVSQSCVIIKRLGGMCPQCPRDVRL